MWIKVKSRFNNLRDRYWPGETRWEPDDNQVRVWIAAGWVVETAAPEETGEPAVPAAQSNGAAEPVVVVQDIVVEADSHA